MKRDHTLFIGWKDPNDNTAIRRIDDRGVARIRLIVERYSQPGKPLTDLPTDFGSVFADARREHQPIKTTERTDECASLARDPVGE